MWLFKIFSQKHPEPFFALARELYPGQFKVWNTLYGLSITGFFVFFYHRSKKKICIYRDIALHGFTTFTVSMYIIVWLTGCLAHSVSLLHEAPEGQRSPETLLLTGWSNTSSLHNWHADGFCRCIHLDSCVCVFRISTLWSGWPASRVTI